MKFFTQNKIAFRESRIKAIQSSLNRSIREQDELTGDFAAVLRRAYAASQTAYDLVDLTQYLDDQPATTEQAEGYFKLEDQLFDLTQRLNAHDETVQLTDVEPIREGINAYSRQIIG